MRRGRSVSGVAVATTSVVPTEKASRPTCDPLTQLIQPRVESSRCVPHAATARQNGMLQRVHVLESAELLNLLVSKGPRTSTTTMPPCTSKCKTERKQKAMTRLEPYGMKQFDGCSRPGSGGVAAAGGVKEAHTVSPQA